METQAASNQGKLSAGTWGTDHLSLEVSEDGAELEFDCAHGSIDSPFMLDENGRFRLKGTYTREAPGPIRVWHQQQSCPAEYVGDVDGDRMTLTVKLIGSTDEVGNYSLHRGKQGRVWKCK